jgi:hypothetical protein
MNNHQKSLLMSTTADSLIVENMREHRLILKMKTNNLLL